MVNHSFTTVWYLPRRHELVGLIVQILFSMSRMFTSQLLVNADNAFYLIIKPTAAIFSKQGCEVLAFRKHG